MPLVNKQQPRAAAPAQAKPVQSVPPVVSPGAVNIAAAIQTPVVQAAAINAAKVPLPVQQAIPEPQDQPDPAATNEVPPVHALSPTNAFQSFPVDEYVPAVIIGYFVADLPPSSYSQTNDVSPSVRFLFSDGDTRKWTKWLKISYHEKSGLSKLFRSVPGLANLLTNNEMLFNTEFKIFLETQNDSDYMDITRAKLTDQPVLMADQIFYDKEYVPYKFVKAYGNVVALRLAVLKTDEGIMILDANDFVDPPPEEQAPVAPATKQAVQQRSQQLANVPQGTSKPGFRR